MKEIHLLILKVLLGEQGPVGTPEMKALLLCSPSTSAGGQMQSLHSPGIPQKSQQAHPTAMPSTVLRKLAGVPWFLLSWCLPKASRHAPALCSPSVSLQWHTESTQGIFLHHLALVARGLPSSSNGTIAIRQFLTGYHTQGTTQAAD